jgi:hypothetical protein
VLVDHKTIKRKQAPIRPVVYTQVLGFFVCKYTDIKEDRSNMKKDSEKKMIKSIHFPNSMFIVKARTTVLNIKRGNTMNFNLSSESSPCFILGAKKVTAKMPNIATTPLNRVNTTW